MLKACRTICRCTPNDTHQSKTDPEAKLYRKGHGQEAKLGYLGHVLMENRNGLIVDAMLTQADGTAERDAAMLMLYSKWRKRRRQGRSGVMSVGADKAYDTRNFVQTMREIDIRPHVAQNWSDQAAARSTAVRHSTKPMPSASESVR